MSVLSEKEIRKRVLQLAARITKPPSKEHVESGPTTEEVTSMCELVIHTLDSVGRLATALEQIAKDLGEVE